MEATNQSTPKEKVSLHNRLTSSVKQILSGYYDAVNLLCSALFVDPDFRVELLGFGCDNAGIPLSCHRYAGGVVGAKTGLGFVLRADQRYGVQAYHIPRNVFVAENTSTEADSPGQFHFSLVESPEGNGSVQVRVPVNTHEDLTQRPGSCFPLQNGVMKRTNQQENDDLPLVSIVTQQLLNSHVGNLAVMFPRTVCRLREKDNSGVHVDSTYTNNPGEVMQGVEMTLALQTVTWPSCARGFKERVRKAEWPPTELINSITDQGVYLVPDNTPRLSPDKLNLIHQFSDRPRDPAKSETEKERATSSSHCASKSNETAFHVYDWKCCFAAAEKRLFETLNEETLNVFHALLLINDGLTAFGDIDPSFEPLLTAISKCVLFWCVEEGIIGQPTKFDDVSKSADDVMLGMVYDVLSYLHKKLQTGCLPHYFLENNNVLEDYWGGPAFVESLKEAVGDLLEQDCNELVHMYTLPLFEMHPLASDLDEARRQAFYKQVLEKSRDTVQAVFTDMYKLAYMALFSNLHRQTSLNRCLEVHESIQRVLTNQVRGHPEPRLLEWTSRLVSNSLANLYAVLALQTPPIKPKPRLSSPKRSPGSSRAYCFQKAEELLLMSNNIDLISGRVRLANFFLATNRLQEAWDLLHDVISVTAGENEARETGREFTSLDESNIDSDIGEPISIHEEEEFGCDHIKNSLLKPIFDRNSILDLLFSEHEKPVLPSVLCDSVHMTVGMLLGINKTSIFLLDPELIVRFLRVITLIKMRGRKEFSVKSILGDNRSPAKRKANDDRETSLSDNKPLAKKKKVPTATLR